MKWLISWPHFPTRSPCRFFMFCCSCSLSDKTSKLRKNSYGDSVLSLKKPYGLLLNITEKEVDFTLNINLFTHQLEKPNF